MARENSARAHGVSRRRSNWRGHGETRHRRSAFPPPRNPRTYFHGEHKGRGRTCDFSHMILTSARRSPDPRTEGSPPYCDKMQTDGRACTYRGLIERRPISNSVQTHDKGLSLLGVGKMGNCIATVIVEPRALMREALVSLMERNSYHVVCSVDSAADIEDGAFGEVQPKLVILRGSAGRARGGGYEQHPQMLARREDHHAFREELFDGLADAVGFWPRRMHSNVCVTADTDRRPATDRL